MANGFKVRKTDTTESYSIEALYEKIKDHTFTAGKPELSRHGQNFVITFPPLDSSHQIWITQAQLGRGPYHSWQIYVNEQVITDGNAAPVTSNLMTRLSCLFKRNGKKAEALIETTARELAALGL